MSGAHPEFARKLFAGPCDFFWGTGDIDSLPPQSLPEIAMVGRSNACAAPRTATAAKIMFVVSQPCQTPTARTDTVAASTNWQIRPIRRRSNWSATR